MTEIYLKEDLKSQIVLGALKLKEAVSCTLGPSGRTVLVKNKDGKLYPTKDGVTVAKEFHELENASQNAGVQMVKDVAIKSADLAGDGTTTSTLLAVSILEKGFNCIEQGTNVVNLKKGIDEAVKEVINELKNNAIEISENSQIKEVATISGNNDEEIGILISSALEKVGGDGVVSIEKSKTGETVLDVVEGIQIDRGYKSPYFVTDNNKMNVVLEEPIILLYDGRITQGKELIPVMQIASNTPNKTLLVIADDIDGEALATLIVNKQRGIVNSVAVKAPDFGDRKKHILEDLAVVTGATLLSKDKGFNLEKMGDREYEKVLGSARLVTVDKETTTIVDGGCETSDIEKRALEIKNQIDNAESAFEKEKLQERLGRLATGVAVIKVGGNSEAEIQEKKDRVEDALHAAKASLEEGIVVGGGVALLRARNKINFTNSNKDVILGKKIIFDICAEPFLKILNNAGIDLTDSIIFSKDISKRKNNWEGYDIETGKIVDFKTKGVIDPLKVVRIALQNSSSVAGMLLTTDAFINQRIENKDGDYSIL